MVKLTPDLIQNSMQYINPVKDRELDLRGNELLLLGYDRFKIIFYTIQATKYPKSRTWGPLWTNLTP